MVIQILTPLVSQTPSTQIGGIALGYPPYQFTDPQGLPTGIDADIAQLVFQEMKKPFQFVQGKWDTIYLNFVHKVEPVTFLCGVEVTPERQRLLDFSKPYYHRSSVIFVKAESTYEKVADLYGKIIAGDRDSFIEKQVEKNRIRVMVTASKEDSFQKLKAGDIVAVIAPLEVGNWICKQQGIQVRTLFETDPGSPVAFAVAKGNTELAMEISQVLDTLQKRGLIEAVMKKYR